MLPLEVDAIVRSLSNRSQFIRQAVLEKMQRDGLL
jgi:metal-responsive CopG/Arc/MetJ family transcriptional regulator